MPHWGRRVNGGLLESAETWKRNERTAVGVGGDALDIQLRHFVGRCRCSLTTERARESRLRISASSFRFSRVPHASGCRLVHPGQRPACRTAHRQPSPLVDYQVTILDLDYLLASYLPSLRSPVSTCSSYLPTRRVPIFVFVFVLVRATSAVRRYDEAARNGFVRTVPHRTTAPYRSYHSP